MKLEECRKRCWPNEAREMREKRRECGEVAQGSKPCVGPLGYFFITGRARMIP